MTNFTQRPQIYTGDVLIAQDLVSGEIDIAFVNGQPVMTNGFETYLYIATFGEDNWQNATTNLEQEKQRSMFPDVIKDGTISDDTVNDGIAALEKALQFCVSLGMCESIDISGEIISVYAIQWSIEITKGGIDTKYVVNWQEGFLTMSKAN